MKRYVVDNRVFLLGLDELYRSRTQPHEERELLACARHVAAVLGVWPAPVPVEGYYADSRALTSYFRLMRALQQVPLEREREVELLPDFVRLLEVTSSPVFGVPVRDGLLPTGRDPLSAALDATPDWTVPRLTAAACAVARATDDCSLVALAARADDPVVLAALRESVVLYARSRLGREPAYEWAVDAALAEAAHRFVDAYNTLFQPGLPEPVAERAGAFWSAYEESDVAGRCVRLGQDRSSPPRYYHWAVVAAPDKTLGVHEFWDERVWTTAQYRDARADPRGRGH